MTRVTIEIDLDGFDDQELINEIEDRGYRVIEDNDYTPDDLIKEEIWFIVELVEASKPGTMGYNIYEKLRKR